MRRITIVQGEHCVIGEPDAVLTTILGSCIAVCLHDPVARLGGMNHFLLAEPSGNTIVNRRDLQRYGVHAMELLINALMASGADRSRLKAHCYGGAQVVAGLGAIGSENAAFARRFLQTEGIATAHEDVGGHHARRVEFMPYLGRSRCNLVHEALPLRVGGAIPQSAAGGELELFA